MRSIANFHDSSLRTRRIVRPCDEMIFLHGIPVHDSAKFGILKRIQRKYIRHILYSIHGCLYLDWGMVNRNFKNNVSQEILLEELCKISLTILPIF